MRLISQDGLLDVSYENVLLNIYDVDRAVVIKAYDSVSSNDFVYMGIYKTVEKTETVMKMVRDKYLEYMSVRGGESPFTGAVTQPGIWVVPKVFQFPQDDEVKV